MQISIKAELKKYADDEAWCDGLNFEIIDYADSNIDDAYYGGLRDGEILMARRILKMIEEI